MNNSVEKPQYNIDIILAEETGNTTLNDTFTVTGDKLINLLKNGKKIKYRKRQ